MNPTATRRAIYGKLAGDSTLNALLGTPPSGWSKNIYYDQAPENATFPYVIFSKQSGVPTYANATAPAYKTDVWLVKAVDKNTTADLAESVSERVETLLSDANLSISGATALWLRPQSDVAYPETDEGQRFVHVGQLYRLVVEPS